MSYYETWKYECDFRDAFRDEPWYTFVAQGCETDCCPDKSRTLYVHVRNKPDFKRVRDKFKNGWNGCKVVPVYVPS